MAIFEDFGAAIESALLIRRTEQRLLDLFNQGKLFGTLHTSIGQEFAAVALGRALREGDAVFSNHRCHGHFLACAGDLRGLVAEIMGRATGVCGGRGGSQHLHSGRFFSNGLLGGTAPIAAGYAYSQLLAGEGSITTLFLGDGAFGEGVVYEAMNLAAKWSLPLLFVCEDNHYAQSTPQSQTLAGTLPGRAAAFGIPVYESTTEDWQALLPAMERSVAQVRSGSGPVFHYVDTCRLMAHSKGDDDRPEEEIAANWARDPLARMLAEFESDPRLKAMLARVDACIDEAVNEAEQAPFAELPTQIPERSGSVSWRTPAFQDERVFKSIRAGLQQAMAADARLHLIGEDIEAPYGGAFKCTGDLSLEFPGRVRNTPISEAAIVGLGTGMALASLRPVVEIMFGDFLGLAFDQWLNHAAKFPWMFNNTVEVPLVVRTPMGGRRGYGATHSQSIEKHFLGIPGTRVLSLHQHMDPAALYARLLAENDRPTLVLENKTLYTQIATAAAPAGFSLAETRNAYPTARLSPDRPADITMVALGGISLEAEKAAVKLHEEEIYVELLLPSCLYPLDLAPILESLQRTSRLLVVEEGQGFVSLGAEILALVLEGFRGRVAARRLAAAPHPIPSARPLEQGSLPQVEDIIEALVDLFALESGDA